MRIFLDKLYLGAGALAGVFIASIAVLILAQVIGRWFGAVVPSTEDFSGFFLAASSFLALAYTLRSGGLIRVSIVIHRLENRRWIELFCLAVFLVLAAYCAWWTSMLVYESWEFDELTQGYIAIPIWIPQVPMALGLIILSIALADELWSVIRGRVPDYVGHEISN